LVLKTNGARSKRGGKASETRGESEGEKRRGKAKGKSEGGKRREEREISRAPPGFEKGVIRHIGEKPKRLIETGH
jgi:hypothetical protein